MGRKKVTPVRPPTVTKVSAGPSSSATTRGATTRRAHFAEEEAEAASQPTAGETPIDVDDDDDDLYSAPTAQMSSSRATRASTTALSSANRSEPASKRAAATREDPLLLPQTTAVDDVEEAEAEEEDYEDEDEDDDTSSDDASLKSESDLALDDEDDDSDPVIRSYDVYLTSEMAEHLHLFQYPIRESGQGYTNAFQMEPVAARIKPKSGFVELDIPIPARESYDLRKGSMWGRVMDRNKTEAAGATPGLAGGFVAGNYKVSKPKRRQAGRSGEASDEDMDMPDDDHAEDSDYDEVAARKLEMEDLFASEPGSTGLQSQTLGGKMYPADGPQPHYMIGVFREDQLHLTPLKTVIQLRPQFHQIDMYNDQIKAFNKSTKDAAAAAGAAAGGGQPFKSEARAVGLSVKSADGPDGNTHDASGVTRTLRDAQDETWKQLNFYDENSEESWAAYSHLFMDKLDKAPRLRSVMNAAQYLDAISPPRTDISGSKKAAKLEKDKGKEEGEEEEVRAASPKRTRSDR